MFWTKKAIRLNYGNLFNPDKMDGIILLERYPNAEQEAVDNTGLCA